MSLNSLELENKCEPQLLGLQIWTAKQLRLKSARVSAVKPQEFQILHGSVKWTYQNSKALQERNTDANGAKQPRIQLNLGNF